MSQRINEKEHKVYKVVLTGGPCGGKTTVQTRMSTFFENLGWKVFRVPETATVLLSGGVKFADLNDEQVYLFQENLIKTMLCIEETFFRLAETEDRDCLVICDRGFMDPVAFLSEEMWLKLSSAHRWDTIHMRDSRYDHIIHLVSASKGAEAFYTLDNNEARSEGLELARQMDDKAQKAWIGHPYFDVVDNSTNFEMKILRAIQVVCDRLQLPSTENLVENRIKHRKFLVTKHPSSEEFPVLFEDFECVHDYLLTPSNQHQARIRKRGHSGHFSYTHTIRRPEIQGERVELKMSIDSREYRLLLNQKDLRRATIYMTRRCFVYQNHYFQLDIFEPPFPERCNGLVILTTYTSKSLPELQLPDFVTVAKEITGNSNYSMYELAKLPGTNSE